MEGRRSIEHYLDQLEPYLSPYDEETADKVRARMRDILESFGDSIDVQMLTVFAEGLIGSLNRVWVDRFLSKTVSLPEVPDLDPQKVQETVRIAKEFMNTTAGLIGGPRRRATGVWLIEQGCRILRGEEPLPPPDQRQVPRVVDAITPKIR